MTKGEIKAGARILQSFAGRSEYPFHAKQERTPYEEVLQSLEAGLTKRALLGLRFAILLVSWCPLFVVGRLRTFSALSMSERERVLTRLLASPHFVLREPLLLLKMAACMAIFSNPASRAGSQFDAPKENAEVEEWNPAEPSSVRVKKRLHLLDEPDGHSLKRNMLMSEGLSGQEAS